MLLSGRFLGISFFQNKVGIPSPTKKIYNTIKIYGNATIDKLQIHNEEIDNATLQNIIITDDLVWTPSTILLAEFENSLFAGNIANLDSPVTQWQISRRESDSSVLKTLDTVDVGVTELIDYECQQGKTYIYEVYAKNANQISEGFVTDEIEMDFYGWYLVGEDSDGSTYVYHLDLNLDFTGYQNEEDFTEHKTFTKFNAFSKGERNFLRGTLSAIAGEISTDLNQLIQPIDYIDTLRNRIQDISTKILKSRKGEIFRVKTHGFSTTPVDNGIGSQPYIVKFDFIQCDNI